MCLSLLATSGNEGFGVSWGPIWSPEGKWILFTWSALFDGETVKVDSYVASMDGQKLFKLERLYAGAKPTWEAWIPPCDPTEEGQRLLEEELAKVTVTPEEVMYHQFGLSSNQIATLFLREGTGSP